jgi:hypothetical protein
MKGKQWTDDASLTDYFSIANVKNTLHNVIPISCTSYTFCTLLIMAFLFLGYLTVGSGFYFYLQDKIGRFSEQQMNGMIIETTFIRNCNCFGDWG